MAQLVKNSPAAGDLGSILGLKRPPEEGKGYPLQYSGLENSTDCIVHGVAKSQTQRSNFHFTSMNIIICVTSLVLQDCMPEMFSELFC